MCMKAESCELQKRVEQIDERLTMLESKFDEAHNETRNGFKEVTAAVNALGHDFGDRMNVIDRRLVEEKEKWGVVLREVVRWTARALLLVACGAAGVNLAKGFIQ